MNFLNDLKEELLRFLQAVGFNPSDPEQKDIAATYLIKLIGTAFFVTMGLFLCLFFPITGFMFILTGVLICPPVWFHINRHLKLKYYFQYIFSAVFFLFAFFFIPISTIQTNQKPDAIVYETPKPVTAKNTTETTPETTSNTEQEQAAKAEQERIAQEQAAAAQAEQERIAQEQAAAAKAEQERIAQEQAAAAKAEQERIAREQAQTNESQIANENTVWIPKTGSKYHSNPNCSGMKNPSQVSLSKAQSLGYEPCKKCY